MALTTQLLRFLICGGLAALINWLARISLSSTTPFTEAIVVAYLIGMTVGFVLYRGIAWPASGKDWHRQLALGKYT